MTVAILYIALGKYIIFWKDFFDSAEKYLLPGIKKEYFVFTNKNIFYASGSKKVHKIKEEFKPWPYSTLKRYSFFLKIKDQLKKFDYIFFFNANCKFLQPVGKEILPTDGNDGLTAVIHPFFYNFPRRYFNYDKNPKSTAYIPSHLGKYYFAGGLNGGKTKQFLEACEILNRNIEIDAKNNIVALWHDESHWNHYLLDKNPVILGPEYLFGKRIPSIIVTFSPKVKLMERPAMVKLYDSTFFNYNLRDIIRACMKKLLSY